jgi:hypothetical protein
MTIEALIEVIPPPDPAHGFKGAWGQVEAELGTALPQDYKDLVRLYGPGSFLEFIWVDVPRARNPHMRLGHHFTAIRDLFRNEEALAYAIWPDPGGLLAFGATTNGDNLFWLPHGEPEDWSVVVWDRGMGEFEVFDCDLTNFLAGLAAGKILPKEFPDELHPCDRLFAPVPAEPEGLYLGTPAVFGVSWRFGGDPDGSNGVSRCRLRGE